MDEIQASEYSNLLKEIKERIQSVQDTAFRAVNKELMRLYRDTGRMIDTPSAGIDGKAFGPMIVKARNQYS